jgi:hypothetical protein
MIFFAAFFKSVMDTVNFHYSTSIFQTWPASFWNLQVSSQGTKFLGDETLDAWHLSQYAFLSLLFAALFFYTPILGYWDFLAFWGIYFATFQLFYGYIFIKH